MSRLVPWCVLACLLGCGEDGPPPEMVAAVSQAEPLWAENARIVAAFPDRSTLIEKPCPAGLRPRRISWTDLCVLETLAGHPCPGTWIPQDGTDEYTDRPKLESRAFYLRPVMDSFDEGRRRALPSVVQLYGAAAQVRVARVTELVEGHRVGADHFAPGHIDGWVVTFDRTTAAVMCAERVRVENDSVTLAGNITGQVRDNLRSALAALEQRTAPRLAMAP